MTAVKRCCACNEAKAIDLFGRNRTKPDGRNYICRVCASQKEKERRSSPDHIRRRATPEYRDSRWAREYAYRKRTPRSTLNVAITKARKRRPNEKSATVEDLMALWREQKGLCALTGIEMTWCTGAQAPTSISIDRIDQEKGYQIDNIRLICFSVNAFRGVMSDADMIFMARAIVRKAGGL